MPHRKPFIDFINDFDLLNMDNVVIFDATLTVEVDEMVIETQSEVHIVTSLPNCFCALYLLHQDSRINDIPTMFQSDLTEVEYLPNEYLKIDGLTIMKDKFTMFIRPDINSDNNE